MWMIGESLGSYLGSGEAPIEPHSESNGREFLDEKALRLLEGYNQTFGAGLWPDLPVAQPVREKMSEEEMRGARVQADMWVANKVPVSLMCVYLCVELMEGIGGEGEGRGSEALHQQVGLPSRRHWQLRRLDCMDVRTGAVSIDTQELTRHWGCRREGDAFTMAINDPRWANEVLPTWFSHSSMAAFRRTSFPPSTPTFH